MEVWANLGVENARTAILEINRRDVARGLYNIASLKNWTSYYGLNDEEIMSHLRSLDQPTGRRKKRVK